MKSLFGILPKSIRNIIQRSSYYRDKQLEKGTIIHRDQIDSILNEAPPLMMNDVLKKKPKVGIIKSEITLYGDEYVKKIASWLRYERFCKNNNIPYDFYDITRSNWLEESEKYDIIVGLAPTDPAYQDMIESKT